MVRREKTIVPWTNEETVVRQKEQDIYLAFSFRECNDSNNNKRERQMRQIAVENRDSLFHKSLSTISGGEYKFDNGFK